MTSKARPFKYVWLDRVRDSDLKPTQRHVLRVLGEYMDDRGGKCFPSVETVAHDTGYGVSTVHEALRSLRAGGWLAVESGGGRFRSNQYRATVPETLQGSDETLQILEENPPDPGGDLTRDPTNEPPNRAERDIVTEFYPSATHEQVAEARQIMAEMAAANGWKMDDFLWLLGTNPGEAGALFWRLRRVRKFGPDRAHRDVVLGGVLRGKAVRGRTSAVPGGDDDFVAFVDDVCVFHGQSDCRCTGPRAISNRPRSADEHAPSGSDGESPVSDKEAG